MGIFGLLVGLALSAGALYLSHWLRSIVIRRYYGNRQAANPFQPGWTQLRDQYDSSHGLLRMVQFSALIGGIWHNDVLQIGFDTQDVVIRNNLGFSSLVRIPYSHIEILQQPESFQVTRLSETEYTPGLFRAGGVVIGLDTHWSAQLLHRMDTGGTLSTS